MAEKKQSDQRDDARENIQAEIRGTAAVLAEAIRPGVIETDIHGTYGEPERPYKIGASTPLGRPGTPDEIAEAIVWLISDASSYVTGAIIDIAGGR